MLLKTDVSQPRGAIAKLGDFGLARVLGAAGAAVNTHGAGSVNHVGAPLCFGGGGGG